jgi:PilZ domain
VAPDNVERKLAAILAAWISGTFLAEDSSVRIPAAEATLTKTLSQAPNDAWARYLLGIIKIFTSRAGQGIAECENALALDRNLAAAHRYIGVAKYFIDRGEETETHVLESLRLSPRDNARAWTTGTGFAQLTPGVNEQPVARFRRAVDTKPILPFSRRHTAPRSARIRTDRIEQIVPAPQERRRYRREKLSVPGRCMLEGRREFPCRTIDISLGGMGLEAPLWGEIGTRVVVDLEHIGRIEGLIVRELKNGFAMKFVAPPRDSAL